MLEFARKDKLVKYIIVFNYDRFSRSGAAAAKLSEDLRKDGIILKSVTQDIDASTASGSLQENFLHLVNNFDNRGKSDRTKINTREVMLKGYWPYGTPLGYDNLKKKHRACFHQYVITEEGMELKKAFILKAENKQNNHQIIALLNAKGVRISEKTFRSIISNPFYAGYITGSLLGGKLIKGMHPPLIDLKTFLKANEILKYATGAGIAKERRHEEVPLKIFAKDEISGMPLTGYKTKGNWYYKIKGGPIPVNFNAKALNEMFVAKLTEFEYKKEYKGKLEKLLFQKLKEKVSKSADEGKVLKKCISEKRVQLEKVEEKFILGEISKELYHKYASRYKQEIMLLNDNLANCGVTSSNLEKSVKKCLEIAQNLSSTWVSAPFDSKQRLQQLVFPEGIMVNKKEGVVRTARVNSLFAEIGPLQRVVARKEKGNLNKDYLLPSSVPTKGIEPSHPCEWQILSLLRLPIPPHGLLNVLSTKF